MLLFGRDKELSTLRAAWNDARQGRGGLVLLTGEPGIGKSSLARALAEEVRATGARVAMGRVFEEGGAPAYWPWHEALSSVGITLSSILDEGFEGEGQTRRLVAFHRVVLALHESTREGALLVWLDDIHAADRATLELLLYVARQVRAVPLLVIATTREAELRGDDTLSSLVARIGREGTRLSLARLSLDDTSAWITARRSTIDVASVHRVSEGNPLFIEEALRLGPHKLLTTAASGVAALLESHLAQLDDATRDVLTAAAVLDRTVDGAETARLCAVGIDAAFAAVRAALDAGVLTLDDDDRAVFSHALLRERLIRALTPSRRRALHAGAAQIAAAADAAPAVIAHHLLEAYPSEHDDGADHDVTRARQIALVDAVCRAAESELRVLAFEPALKLVERAAGALKGTLSTTDRLRFDLLRADAFMRSGDGESGRAIALTAAVTAKVLGDARALARAALLFGAELTSGRVDADMVRLLEDARAALDDSERDLRARVGARLAAAWTPPRSPDEAEAAVALARASIALAEETGDDETLLFVLRFAGSALGYMISAEERWAYVDRTMALALKKRDQMTLLHLGGFQIAMLVERGQIDEAARRLEAFTSFVDGLGLFAARWRSLAAQASFAGFTGDLPRARALGDALYDVAKETNSPPALTAFALHTIALHVVDAPGVGEELPEDRAQAVVNILSRVPPLSPWLACLHALRGRADEARLALEPVMRHPEGFPWLITAGEAIVRLDDVTRAEVVYTHLLRERFRGRFFWGPAGVFALGPTARVLGELALLLGRRDEARAHLDEAVRLCQEIGARALLAMSLRARARLDENTRSARAPRARPHAAPSRVRLTREGKLWRVEQPDAAAFHLPHAKGVEFLDVLLRHPGTELFVLVVAGSTEAPSDAGLVLDDTAREQYRARAAALTDEMDLAVRFGDRARESRAREELDALASALARATGLGGRARKAASNVERARINVQRRLKDTIARITDVDPHLGRYLEATVRTGTYCAYIPL